MPGGREFTVQCGMSKGSSAVRAKVFPAECCAREIPGTSALVRSGFPVDPGGPGELAAVAVPARLHSVTGIGGRT